MTSKAKARRNKKAVQRRNAEPGPEAPENTATAPQRANSGRGDTMRPTPERQALGRWAVPQGGVKSQQPVVDMASDMIGLLHCQRRITDAQEQAARTWQELRAKWLQEFPDLAQFKSCLHGSVPGYDDSEGDASVIAAYRAVEAKMTLPQRRMMLWVCDMNERPANIAVLRQALDVVGG